MRVVSPGLSRAAAHGSSGVSAAKFSATLGGAHRGADLGIDRRDRGDAVEQGAQIKPGAADQDRQAPRGVDRGDLGARQLGPVGGRAGVGAVAHAVEAMLGALAVGGRGGGREDRQVAIELARCRR